VLPESNATKAIIRVNYIQLPQEIVDGTGNVVERVKRDTALLEVRTAWTSPGRWQIMTIKVVRL